MTYTQLQQRRNAVLNRPKSVPRYTDVEKTLYMDTAKNRAITIHYCPPYIKEKLNIIVAYILHTYPKTEYIGIAGSYMKGEWVDEHTSEEFKRLRELIRFKTKISDFDMIVSPYVQDSFSIDDMEVQIMPPSNASTLLYKCD